MYFSIVVHKIKSGQAHSLSPLGLPTCSFIRPNALSHFFPSLPSQLQSVLQTYTTTKSLQSPPRLPSMGYVFFQHFGLNCHSTDYIVLKICVFLSVSSKTINFLREKENFCLLLFPGLQQILKYFMKNQLI